MGDQTKLTKIQQAGQRITEFIVNDYELQGLMGAYILQQFKDHGLNILNSKDEPRIEHALYYTWASEWHTAALAEAIRNQNEAIDKLG